MTQEDCKISVIIATRNRAEALEKISLPALAKQTFKDFEVIVWDASENDDSAEVVKGFPELNIRYFKAPRVGSCSQRNDAVKVARGEIVYFIDDDSEPSPEVLEAIYEAMNTGELAGCSPPVFEKDSPKFLGVRGWFLEFLSKIFFMGGWGGRNRVLKSGRAIWSSADSPGKGQILHGNSMAYRIEVFTDHRFDEELERFGGWASGDDVMFPFSLLREGFELSILEKGRVIHHHIRGGRVNDLKAHAMSIFNYFLIWKKTIYPFDKKSIAAWSLSIIGSFILGILVLLTRGNAVPLRGFFLGLKEIFNYLKKT